MAFAGAGFGEIVTIKALAEQGLDDGLPANVEFLAVADIEHALHEQPLTASPK